MVCGRITLSCQFNLSLHKCPSANAAEANLILGEWRPNYLTSSFVNPISRKSCSQSLNCISYLIWELYIGISLEDKLGNKNSFSSVTSTFIFSLKEWTIRTRQKFSPTLNTIFLGCLNLLFFVFLKITKLSDSITFTFLNFHELLLRICHN